VPGGGGRVQRGDERLPLPSSAHCVNNSSNWSTTSSNRRREG